MRANGAAVFAATREECEEQRGGQRQRARRWERLGDVVLSTTTRGQWRADDDSPLSRRPDGNCLDSKRTAPASSSVMVESPGGADRIELDSWPRSGDGRRAPDSPPAPPMPSSWGRWWRPRRRRPLTTSRRDEDVNAGLSGFHRRARRSTVFGPASPAVASICAARAEPWLGRSNSIWSRIPRAGAAIDGETRRSRRRRLSRSAEPRWRAAARGAGTGAAARAAAPIRGAQPIADPTG